MAKDVKAEAETPEVPKKKSKKLLIIVIVLVVALLIVGGGVALLLMKKNSTNAEGAAAPAEHVEAVEKAGPPVYAALDTFTVNLIGDQYLQLIISVEVKDVHVAEELKVYTPKLRNNVMLLLSGKQASDLMTKEGKETLASEIRTLMNTVLEPAAKPGEGPVKEVLFTSFIIQ